METAFDVLISRLDMAEERISKFGDNLTVTSKSEKWREKDWKEKKNMGQLQKV